MRTHSGGVFPQNPDGFGPSEGFTTPGGDSFTHSFLRVLAAKRGNQGTESDGFLSAHVQLWALAYGSAVVSPALRRAWRAETPLPPTELRSHTF